VEQRLVQGDRIALRLALDVEIVERLLDDLAPRPARGEAEARVPARERDLIGGAQVVQSSATS
jgi:hypothetical protein